MDRQYLNNSKFKYTIYIIVGLLQLYFILSSKVLIIFITILLEIFFIKNKKIFYLFLLLTIISIIIRLNFILNQVIGLFSLIGINLNINTYLVKNGFAKVFNKSQRPNGRLVIDFRNDDTGDEIENLKKQLKNLKHTYEREAVQIRIDNLVLAANIRRDNIEKRKAKRIREELDKNFYFMFCAPISFSSIQHIKDLLQLRNKSITEKDVFIFNKEYYKFSDNKFKKIPPVDNLSEKFMPHIKENVNFIFIKHNTAQLTQISLHETAVNLISQTNEFIYCYLGVQTQIYMIDVKYKECSGKEIVQFWLKPYKSIENCFSEISS